MKFLFNYTESNPLVINNYPYGFKLKTQIRYWIETTPKKGDRFCSQTLNPKNNRWNAPKKSTYSCIGIMVEKENGHISWAAVSTYDYGQKTIDFIDKVGKDNLNPDQLKMYNQLTGNNVKEQNEFTGKVKKDYAVKWEKDKNDKCDEVRITFDRPDGVKLKEIFEAMKGLNQIKLNEVFELREYPSFGKSLPGIVRICTRGGNQLVTIKEAEYKNYLASDENVIKAELSATE